jgi:uncharacterized protein (DUF362 family)
MVLRREFLRWLAASFLYLLSGCVYKKETITKEQEVIKGGSNMKKNRSKVYVIKTIDRKTGIQQLMKKFDLEHLSQKRVALKANYNSSDPYPASTHIDTLSAIVEELKEKKAKVVVAERSGMGNTKDVLEETGVVALSSRLGFDVVVLDDLKGSGWVMEIPEKGHWKKGFLFPELFREADAIVQTCCLKTHRFGGHFTMSLKNSVGMVAKYDPEDGYNYMSELHTSRYQRQMIAEINTVYSPEIIIMDGIKGFSKGGPDTGTLIEPGVLIAGNDRVALDAVGIAILRIFGTSNEVSRGTVFEQEQINRAVELGLGASGPDEIEVIPINNDAQGICLQIQEKLVERL